MRDPKRIDEVLKELGKFWKKNPDKEVEGLKKAE